MQPLRAIGFTLIGFFVLLFLSSFLSNSGKEVVSNRVCPVVQEAYRLCKLPPQDRKRTTAIVHASSGLGMIQAVRELVADEAVAARCRIDPSEVSRLCQKYRLDALNGAVNVM